VGRTMQPRPSLWNDAISVRDWLVEARESQIFAFLGFIVKILSI
jgi:hypothetical protein